MTQIILASTSRYRQKLLSDAGFIVTCMPPNYDELPQVGVDPQVQIAEFARGKARSIAYRFPEAVVIGSDQGLVCGGQLIGKPGTVDAACRQLQQLRGQTAVLATSLAVIRGDQILEHQDCATLHFRADLSDEAILRYVLADRPLDCAGSFKIESRGSRLFTAIETRDPSAIQGLPMMALNAFIVSLCPEADMKFD